MSIKIDTTALISAADIIRQQKGKYSAVLQSADRTAQYLKNSWKSPAGNEFIHFYLRYMNDVDTNSRKIFDQYAGLLYNTAGKAYEPTENAMKKNASSFHD